MLKGIGVSGGVGIGKAYRLGRYPVRITKSYLKKSEREKEVQRFKNAVAQSIAQLIEIKKRAAKDVKPDHLFIIDTHLMVLRDDVFIEDVLSSVREKCVSAEWAIKNFLTRFTKSFKKIGNEYLKSRKIDIEHIAIRVVNNLAGSSQESLSDLKEPVIIIANDLSPSDTLQMDRKMVLGFATDVGGNTSHTALLAAGLSIPAVVGLGDITSRVSNNDALIIDGKEGIVVIKPGRETFKAYLKKQQRYKYYEKELLKFKDLPSETKDGHKVKLMANIGSVDEISSVSDFRADGVGLYRTEYRFMSKQRLPTEGELFTDYKKVAKILAPKTIIIRTVDLGGDKLAPLMGKSQGVNPALGLRAIRLCLSHVKIFKTQLRSILRASAYGKIKIMFPMISGIEELRKTKKILEEVKNELRRKSISFDEDIKTGIMIEIPSAALTADHLAKETDFFSIGTNDLIQYSIGVDRGNEQVSYLYKPLHPAILKLINGVILAANKENIPVGICGEMGSDPRSIPVLLGLGKIEALSMESHSIPKVKKVIQLISMQEAKDIAEKVLTFSSEGEVSSFIEPYIKKAIPFKFG